MRIARQARKNRGSAVMVILVLLALMTVYVTSNAIALHTLKRNLQIIEKKQVSRIKSQPARQNIVIEEPRNGQN